MRNLTNDEIHKEIDLIQSCINRMAKNSFMVKGWMVTLVAAFVALLSDKVSEIVIAVLSGVIIFCFWFIDGFFLKTEKLFRKKYEWVIKNRHVNNGNCLYDLNPYNKEMWLNPDEKMPNIVSCMFTKTLIPFYGVPLLVAISVILLKLFKCI